MITIVGSARGSASLPNKNSVPSTKIAGYDKHTSCATSTAATKTSIIETIQCYIARTFDKQSNNTAASKAHGKCIKLRSPLMGSFSNRQRPSSAKLQHYHRSIEQSSTTVDETIRAHIIDAARRIPSPPDLHSYAQCPTEDHAPTKSTKEMGNHRTSCILKK